MPGSSDDMVLERADILDLDFDRIAGFHGADARRRARRDDVSRLQRHDARNELDELIDVEDHILRITVLLDLAIEL